MDTPVTLQIVEITFAVSALGYGIFENYKRQKLEQFSKATLRGMAGNIAKIQQSTAWATTNLRDAHNTATQLPESDLKPPLLKFISNGIGDVTATDRLVINLFNDVLNMQQAQFNTRIVTHPERDFLDLYKKEQAQLAKPNATGRTTKTIQ